jgi:hypothetical protein
MTFRQVYEKLAHAIQTGVAVTMGMGDEGHTPKHLRTGLNLALCDHGSLVRLLIDKCIITEEEYQQYVQKGLESEVKDYERRIGRATGKKVTLG